jgi:hypothetical protein
VKGTVPHRKGSKAGISWSASRVKVSVTLLKTVKYAGPFGISDVERFKTDGYRVTIEGVRDASIVVHRAIDDPKRWSVSDAVSGCALCSAGCASTIELAVKSAIVANREYIRKGLMDDRLDYSRRNIHRSLNVL